MNSSSQIRALLLATAIPLFIIYAALFAPEGARSVSPLLLQNQDLPRVNRSRLIRDFSILAHDSMEGRRAGTPGGERARRFLLTEFEDRTFSRVSGERTQEFPIGSLSGGEGRGINVIGMIEGREFPDQYLVISAHYDHLGVLSRDIYNGADDNASGTAALLAIGGFFVEHRPRHSLLFVAFDAEELGLLGAQAFISDPPVPLGSLLLNVNLDMVSRSESGELYAAGTYHYPVLIPLVEEVAGRSEVSLLRGHDSPALANGDDWTTASDHGPFHEARIPFVYFGVEDHAGYHRPSDTLENVTLDFYVKAVDTILDFIQVADQGGDALD